MIRRQMIALAAAVLGAAVLTAWGAYRLGVRRGAARARPDDASQHCVDIKQAGDHVGEQACVTGRVLRVYTSRAGNTFLDFCPDYRSCPFTSVIFASDRSKFGNLATLASRKVELTGTIKLYRSQPEIIISAPDQLREAP